MDPIDGSGPAAGTGHTIAVQARSISVRFTEYSFGSVRVDGVTYDHDLIIDRGKVRKRKKAASRKFRGAYGHTPLSIAENIPWRCRRLVVGSGADGALPVMQQVRDEARRRAAARRAVGAPAHVRSQPAPSAPRPANSSPPHNPKSHLTILILFYCY